MHFISRIILHHFFATYNHFFKFPRKHKNKTHGDWPKPPISMGNVKKVLSRKGIFGARAGCDRPLRITNSGEGRRCGGTDRRGRRSLQWGTQCVCDCRGDLCVARGGVIQLPGHRWCRGGIGFRATVRIGGAVVRTVRGTPVPTEEERSAFVIVGATCVSPVAEGEIRIDDR